jgi:predicted phosphodiesterase
MVFTAFFRRYTNVMRLAIFSDVHGNGFALEAVLNDLLTFKPDVIANLGDQVWGASNPHGAWSLLQQIQCVNVRGNTDEMISSKFDTLSEEAHAYASWLREQLPYDAPATLDKLPLTAELAEGEVVIAHGALHDPWEALLFEDRGQGVEPRSEKFLLEQATAFPKAKVFVVGHTHRELLRSTGGVTFINAGPVSRPMDHNPAARWLLLEKQHNNWNLSFHRVHYDVQAAANWALKNSPFGQPEAELINV